MANTVQCGLRERVGYGKQQEIQMVPNLVQVQADVVMMENLTLRLSDDYLDLDLLDEQARSVLGMIRADEIVIR